MKSNPRAALSVGCLAAFLVCLFFAGGCSSAPQTGPGELRVLCGSSMAVPAQAIQPLFESAHGVKVLFDLGGSETLLPRVIAGGSGDVFICHDPFEEKVRDAGYWAGSAVVGRLEPVLLVRPGNPANLRSVTDLTNQNLKIGIGDPRYSTCGELFVALLERKGIKEPVLNQVALMGRTHSEIAQGLLLGPLDAIVVWNYIARMYSNKVELVPTQDEYPDLNVTVVGLKQSANPKGRDDFLAFCRSEQVKKIFAEHGYGTAVPSGPDGAASQ